MKAVVAAFNQVKALVGAFSVIVQLVVEPMDRFAALFMTLCSRCFGVLEPGYYGAVDLNTGRSYLYQPKLKEEYRLWMGHIPSNQEVGWSVEQMDGN